MQEAYARMVAERPADLEPTAFTAVMRFYARAHDFKTLRAVHADARLRAAVERDVVWC